LIGPAGGAREEVWMHREITVVVRIDEDETNPLVFAELDSGGDRFESAGTP